MKRSAREILGQAFMKGTTKGQLESIYKTAVAGDNVLKVMAYRDAICSQELPISPSMTPRQVEKMNYVFDIEDDRPYRPLLQVEAGGQLWIITQTDGERVRAVNMRGMDKPAITRLCARTPIHHLCGKRFDTEEYHPIALEGDFPECLNS